ncbi:MAG: hypothetical protein ACRCXZ_06300 [Patescibacteria group bacterium]
MKNFRSMDNVSQSIYLSELVEKSGKRSSLTNCISMKIKVNQFGSTILSLKFNLLLKIDGWGNESTYTLSITNINGYARASEFSSDLEIDFINYLRRRLEPFVHSVSIKNRRITFRVKPNTILMAVEEIFGFQSNYQPRRIQKKSFVFDNSSELDVQTQFGRIISDVILINGFKFEHWLKVSVGNTIINHTYSNYGTYHTSIEFYYQEDAMLFVSRLPIGLESVFEATDNKNSLVRITSNLSSVSENLNLIIELL